MKQYIIRKEYFGGLVYDKKTFNYYVIDEYGFEIISNVHKFGFDGTLDYYKDNKESLEDVTEYLEILKENNLIENNVLNGTLICNDSKHNTLSAPIKAYLTITDICNLKCSHCFGDFGKGSQLNKTQIKEILDELKSLGICEISITGGEPLCHPDIIEIIEMIVERDFNFQICTNGLMIDDDFIKVLKRFNSRIFRLSISLDGIAEIHNKIRGENTYEKTIVNIKKLQEEKIPFAVNNVMNNLNIDYIEEFLDNLNDLGIKSCSFSPIIPTGRAVVDSNLTLVNNRANWKEKFLNAIECMEKYTESKGFNIYFYGRTIGKQAELGCDESLLNILNLEKCGAGSIIVTIKSNGHLLPCVFLSESLEKRNILSESILEKSLKEIWDNNEQFKFIRQISAHDSCKKCNHHKKSCTGGCPAISDKFFNDFIVPDPYCPRNN